MGGFEPPTDGFGDRCSPRLSYTPTSPPLWCPRRDSNPGTRFRKPLLYPPELQGHKLIWAYTPLIWGFDAISDTNADGNSGPRAEENLPAASSLQLRRHVRVDVHGRADLSVNSNLRRDTLAKTPWATMSRVRKNSFDHPPVPLPNQEGGRV